MAIIVKLHHNGNSLAVTIPAPYRRKLGWFNAQYVYLLITDQNELLIRRVDDAPKISGRDGRASAGKPSDSIKQLRRGHDRNRAITPP